MGRYNFKPSRVYQTATLALETYRGSGRLPVPPWFKTIGLTPPGEILTRIPVMRHQGKVQHRRTKKPSKMFIPLPITYEEDQLRKKFYSDHPWELARPRTIVEQDGKDGQTCDWSKMQQPGRQLNAESVVQRQLWLLHNVQGMTRMKAYDIAREEFYALRHEEDVERRIAKEEALSTGAYFGKSFLEIGMQLEDQNYEEWKSWATTQVELANRMKNSVYRGPDGTDEDATTSDVVDSDLIELEAPVPPEA